MAAIDLLRDGDLKSTVYPPTFMGTPEDFQFYKPKVESYLAGAGLGIVLMDGDNVQPDNHAWSTDPADAVAVEEGKKLQYKNRKAAGIVLNSIDTSSKKGKQAFKLLAKFHDANTGFAGGHFKREWTVLCDWYEQVEKKDKATLRLEIYK